MTLDDFRLQTSGAVSLLKRMLGRSDRDANSARVSDAAPTSPLSDSLGTVAS